jgi:hypothetical protein
MPTRGSTWMSTRGSRSRNRPCAARVCSPSVLEAQAVQRVPRLYAPGPVRTLAQGAQHVLRAPDPHPRARVPPAGREGEYVGLKAAEDAGKDPKKSYGVGRHQHR